MSELFIKSIEAISPGTTGAADHTGDYISMKNFPEGVIVHIHMDQANAATAVISILQATAVAGTGVKAIANAVPIWANQDCASSDLKARQTDAVSFTTSAAVKHKIVEFYVRPEMLDVANGFDCLAVKVATSNIANLMSACYIALDWRYEDLSAIAD